ncbi:MAG: type II toxin-antitoxin system RelE/ParE family toxin [Verrucomicrobiales bacterium]|nr:type II toxin-antitoxin system RelE/ParE family toxin [Verrucomicrobiales bacterium]
MKIVFGDDVACDLKQAVCYYRKGGADLAARFLSAYQSSLDSLRSHPFKGPVVEEPVRRVLIPRFPYALYYFVEGDTICVGALASTWRDATHWRERFD